MNHAPGVGIYLNECHQAGACIEYRTFQVAVTDIQSPIWQYSRY